MSIDIFFDLDGTLIDAAYRPNTDASDFRAQLARLGAGTRVHLNSNRSFEQLMPFYRLFGFNGHMVLENGCCYADPSTGITSTSCAMRFDRQELQRSMKFPVAFTSTDPIAEGRAEGFDDGTYVFAEASRNYTMTLYPRHVAGSVAIQDSCLLYEVYERAQNVFKDYEVSYDSTTYWNILLKPRGILKSTLIPKLSRSEQIASFGDSKDDVCMFECSEFCGAPANASASAKTAALSLGGIITPHPYTLGAIEFLQAVEAFF